MLAAGIQEMYRLVGRAVSVCEENFDFSHRKEILVIFAGHLVALLRHRMRKFSILKLLRGCAFTVPA